MRTIWKKVDRIFSFPIKCVSFDIYRKIILMYTLSRDAILVSLFLDVISHHNEH